EDQLLLPHRRRSVDIEVARELRQLADLLFLQNLEVQTGGRRLTAVGRRDRGLLCRRRRLALALRFRCRLRLGPSAGSYHWVAPLRGSASAVLACRALKLGPRGLLDDQRTTEVGGENRATTPQRYFAGLPCTTVPNSRPQRRLVF